MRVKRLDLKKHTDQLFSLYKAFEEVNFTCVVGQDLSSRFAERINKLFKKKLSQYSTLQIHIQIYAYRMKKNSQEVLKSVRKMYAVIPCTLSQCYQHILQGTDILERHEDICNYQ